jgi:glycosyltransferase involved in cell wall biosynthesis
MHVCLVSLDYKPFRSSGLTIYAEDLARGLSEAGLEVTVLAALRPDLPECSRLDGIKIYRAKIRSLDWITYGWEAARLLDRLQLTEHFDLIHFLDVHFAYCYSGPFVASIWQSFRQRLTARDGGPYHNGWIDWLRRQIYYRLARTVMEQPSVTKAGRLIAACVSTREEFIRNYRLAPNRIDLGIQGIDTDFFRPVAGDVLRRRLGLEDCRVLLFAGFITPRKGLEYLAGALRSLPDDIHLVIIGRWEHGYRPIFERALGAAAGRVHDVGFVADDERPAYYSMADLYVSPSYLEGLGVTPIEAMACGTPVVVTSASSGPEEAGEGGIIVPPRDSDALAQAILSMLDDRPRCELLGRLGRERVVRDFSYRRMADLTIQTYHRFLQDEK